MLKAGNSAIFKVNISLLKCLKVIPPPGWKARQQGYNNLDFLVKSKYHWKLWVDSKHFHQLFIGLLFFINLEPIEQNVHGSKGVYELVYFLKDSRPIERFKKMALESERYI